MDSSSAKNFTTKPYAYARDLLDDYRIDTIKTGTPSPSEPLPIPINKLTIISGTNCSTFLYALN